MAKEGEEGRKKIAAITRYVTVVLGLIQGTAYYFYLRNNQTLPCTMKVSPQVFAAIIIVLAFTAGTALMMWMGEQINQKGIGNGISILLVCRYRCTSSGYDGSASGATSRLQCRLRRATASTYVFAPLFIILFLAVIWVIVFMNDSERRIPVQYAKTCGWQKDVRRPEQPYPADQS